MMTVAEVQALADILSKATMSKAEHLWAQSLVDRLMKVAQANEMLLKRSTDDANSDRRQSPEPGAEGDG